MTQTITTPTSTSTTTSSVSAGHVDTGDVRLWVDRRGAGPEVLLLAGLSDTTEAWSFQWDQLAASFTLTSFDNRGAGRSSMIPAGFSVADMADDAAAVIRASGTGPVHVAGFSGGSVTAQELALRHPDLVRSLVLVSTWARLDRFARSVADSLAWMAAAAPDERAMLEAFFVWIYTSRAHADGTVAAIIDEALAFPFPQEPEAFQRQLATWMAHDAADRLPRIAVPTLVVAGEVDMITPPRLGREVAELIPGAEFVVLAGEAHQPFQEAPDVFNDLVAGFWNRVNAGGPNT